MVVLTPVLPSGKGDFLRLGKGISQIMKQQLSSFLSSRWNFADGGEYAAEGTSLPLSTLLFEAGYTARFMLPILPDIGLAMRSLSSP